ncbi:MAG: hypothetical protein LLG40_04660, partial [Deltaproteobacteria bacterium]|nr:hypothetical protein [Deltaproteobacteria bacterium]
NTLFLKFESHNKKATKTIKYLAANLCASKCLNSTLSFVYFFLNIRSWENPTVIADNSQALFASITVCRENMGQEY